MRNKAPSSFVKAWLAASAGLGALVACAQFHEPPPRYWEIREIAPPIVGITQQTFLPADVPAQFVGAQTVFSQPTFTPGGPPVFAGGPPNVIHHPGQILLSGQPGALPITPVLGATTPAQLIPQVIPQSSGLPGLAPRLPSAQPSFRVTPGGAILTDAKSLGPQQSYRVVSPLREWQPLEGAFPLREEYRQVSPLSPPSQRVPPAHGGAPNAHLAHDFRQPAAPALIQVQGQPFVAGVPGHGATLHQGFVQLAEQPPARASGFLGQRELEQMQRARAAGFLDPARDPLRTEPRFLDGVPQIRPVDPALQGQGLPHTAGQIVPSIAGRNQGPVPVAGPLDARDQGPFRFPAQPAFGTMQGGLGAPRTGPGALGSSFIDPTTGNPRDFRHVILTPETMDPRNVNRRALDRLSAISLRGYTRQTTEGVFPDVRPPGAQGMQGPAAAPYWRMIADDIAEQIFLVQPPGRLFYYVEPATRFRNRTADAVFRLIFADALRARGAQIAPSPEFASGFIRLKVDLFDLNPLAFTGQLSPPDYTPLFSDTGHMVQVVDRGLTQTRGFDLAPVSAPDLGFPSLSQADPFLRPFTGIMVSGIVEERGKGAFRVHGAYYVDRGGI